MAKLPKASNKGIKSEVLPSRHALANLAGGDPMRRMLGDYAKASPADASGKNNQSSGILVMGKKGASL